MNIFYLRPTPKPRMVSSDKWKIPKGTASKAIYRYLEFKELLNIEANKQGFKIEGEIYLQFCFEMPKSWSNKKKAEMLYTKHEVKPDGDNCLKAFLDALCKEDSGVHTKFAKKIWAEKDCIIATTDKLELCEKILFWPEYSLSSDFGANPPTLTFQKLNICDKTAP